MTKVGPEMQNSSIPIGLGVDSTLQVILNFHFKILFICIVFASFKYLWDMQKRNQGAVSIRKTVLPGMAIPMLKIRLPNGRLIFNMEIARRR